MNDNPQQFENNLTKYVQLELKYIKKKFTFILNLIFF